MERYILLQDKRAPASTWGGRKFITAALRVVAAVSVTATLTLALLPPTDVAAVQQALAATAPPSGTDAMLAQA